MGANAQTSVPLFTAGEVLTAQNQNLSAGTGVPVFATTTTRDAAFGGTGEKVLAEGQLCYLESTDVVQYYNGSAWATVGPASAGAVTRIGGGTLSGASTAFTSVFSTTYRVYMVTGSSVLNATSNSSLKVTLGASATGYYNGRSWTSYAGVADPGGTSNGTSWDSVSTIGTTNANGFILFFINPFEALPTTLFSLGNSQSTSGSGGASGGWHNSATSYTDFTLAVSAGTFSTGTVNIYGFALS